MLELALYGGAVFTLVYGSRETTKDIDGIIRPTEIGQRLVKAVAKEQDLPDDWLNPDVQQFLSPFDQRRPFPSKEYEPGLNITIPTANYLLALKLNACRQPLPGYLGDEADIRFLLSKMKPTSVEEIEVIHNRFFIGEGLHARAIELIEEYLGGTS